MIGKSEDDLIRKSRLLRKGKRMVIGSSGIQFMGLVEFGGRNRWVLIYRVNGN